MEKDLINANQADFVTNKINSLLDETNEYYAALERTVRIYLKMAEDPEDVIGKIREELKKENSLRSKKSKSRLRHILLKLRMLSFISEVVMPLFYAIQHIVLYRSPERSMQLLNSLDFVPNSRVSIDDFFYILTKLPRRVSGVIIDSILCSIHDKELLCQYLIDNNKESFVNLIYSKNIDTTNVLKICSIYSDKILAETIMSTPLDEEKMTILEELFTPSDLIVPFEEFFPALSQVRECVERDEYDNLEPFTLAFKEVLQLYLIEKNITLQKNRLLLKKL